MLAFLWSLGCDHNENSPTYSKKNQPSQESLPDNIKTLIQEHAPTDINLAEKQWLTTNVNPPDLFDTSYDIYAVTFIWGHLFNLYDSSIDITTDWSGSMYVNGVSIIAPVYAIDFEAGQDSIIGENDSARAEWVSSVCGDFDGLTSLIFLKRGITYVVAPWLSFEASPIALQFDFFQLENLTAFYKIDSANALVVHARRIWPHHCPEGTMIGEWIKANNAGDSGYFSGQWLDDNGNLTGIYSGYFCTSNDGSRIFEGWLSHPILDVVLAYMRGTWSYDDPRMCPLCGTGYGRYKGVFKFDNEPKVGIIEGEFIEHNIGSLEMTMRGRWKVFCPFTTDYSDNIE